MGRYPRRGEHGDPRPRCQWCGKTYDRGILDPMGEIPYCSFKCRMAGAYGFMTCMAFVTTFMTASVTSFLVPIMVTVSGAWAIMILVLFWGLTILLWLGVYVGYRVRSASVEQEDNPIWEVDIG